VTDCGRCRQPEEREREREPVAVAALLRLLHLTAWRLPPLWRRRLGRLAAFRRFEELFFGLLGERVIRAREGDFSLVVDLRDFDQRAQFRNPHVEAHVVEYLQGHLRPGSVAVDVGAFCGYYTALMATLVSPGGAVFAFEPTPAHAARVRRQVELNGFTDVTVLEVGVADCPGTSAFAMRGPASHLVPAGHDAGPAIDVELVALDSLFTGGNRDKQWVIKLDVEGAELRALRGMEALLASGRARVVVEVNSTGVEEEIRAFISRFPVTVREIGHSLHGTHLAIEPSLA
jgi:FkbM family methyltransferase